MCCMRCPHEDHLLMSFPGVCTHDTKFTSAMQSYCCKLDAAMQIKSWTTMSTQQSAGKVSTGSRKLQSSSHILPPLMDHQLLHHIQFMQLANCAGWRPRPTQCSHEPSHGSCSGPSYRHQSDAHVCWECNTWARRGPKPAGLRQQQVSCCSSAWLRGRHEGSAA